MQKIIARALFSEYFFQAEIEVARIDYSKGILSLEIGDLISSQTITVEFDQVVGFRVLDERDLMEYWPTCSIPNGWLFEIIAGGWLQHEAKRSIILVHLSGRKRVFCGRRYGMRLCAW